MFDLVSKICSVRFIEVKFHLKSQFSVYFTQVSAVECPLYRGDFMRSFTVVILMTMMERQQIEIRKGA